MSEELLPCPFCGVPADAGWFAITHNIGCEKCQYSLDACKSDIGLSYEDKFTPEAEASIARFNINRWNTRADLARAQVAAAYREAVEVVQDHTAAYFGFAHLDPFASITNERVARALGAVYFELSALTPDDAKAALDDMLKAERAKAHKKGQMAAFKKVIGHLTGNKPDPIGNHRTQGYYRGWMDALKAVRKLERKARKP